MTEEEKIEKLKQMLSPRLTILEFTIKKLGNKPTCFRDLLLAKLDLKSEIDNKVLLSKYLADIIKNIDTDSFVVPNSARKKGITLEGKSKINLHSEKCIIEGVISGGVFGRKRKAKKVKSKKETKDLGENEVISDDYYFMLFLPLNFDKAYLLLHSYPDINIKSEIETFFKRSLSTKGFKKASVKYYSDPERTKDFQDNCILDHLTYSTTFIDSDIGENVHQEEIKDEFYLKVQVGSLVNKPIIYSMISSFMEKANAVICNSKVLKRFTDKKMTLKNKDTGKMTTFDVDEDMKLRPVIYLYEEIKVSDDGIPDFEELKVFCFSEIDKIKKREIPEL